MPGSVPQEPATSAILSWTTLSSLPCWNNLSAMSRVSSLSSIFDVIQVYWDIGEDKGVTLFIFNVQVETVSPAKYQALVKLKSLTERPSLFFINESISVLTDPSPSVTVLIRGTAGRHAWTMQLFHQPRGARASQRVRSHC